MLEKSRAFAKKYLVTCLLLFALFAILTGLVYPLTMTGVAQVAFKDKANGSMVFRDGHAVGSKLIGQSFEGQQYFHGRPSVAGTNGYDAVASGASNLGLTRSPGEPPRCGGKTAFPPTRRCPRT
jgi:potassium-transporting ATPase KdpC subunit